MVLDRLQQLTMQVSASAPPPHPLDPLTTTEIETAVDIVRKEHGKLNFNGVTLYEPRKEHMMAWLANPEGTPRPTRAADVVAIAPGGKIYDGIVDLDAKKIIQWKHTPGVQPLITMEDLQEVEHIARKDPKVIEQCGILGIPPQDMDKVYCDRKSGLNNNLFCFSNESHSLDNRIRRALRHGYPSTTSSHVLPTSR